MTFTSILQSLIDNSEANQQILDDLIAGRKSVTFESADSVTPAPTVDSNDVWTLTQDTADANGVYKGSYKLALSTACATVTVVSTTGHTNPTDGSAPARYKACDASAFTDLTAIGDLHGQQVVEIEIASQTAFELKLTLATSWTHTFDFSIDKQGWIDSGTTSQIATYITGQYWAWADQQADRRICDISLDLVTPIEITSISMKYDRIAGTYMGNSQHSNFEGLRMGTNDGVWNRFAAIPTTGLQDGSEQTITIDRTASPTTINGLRCAVTSSFTTNDTWNGEARIKSITLTGAGVNPFI